MKIMILRFYKLALLDRLLALLCMACFTTLLGTSCADERKKISIDIEDSSSRQIDSSFKEVLDSAGVVGSILIYDTKNNEYKSNDYRWANTGFLPASTFKIPNSIIAIESGVRKDATSMNKWNGEDRAMDRWERDLTLKEAFHLSCVPCYQDIAQDIGVDRMISELDSLDFGEMEVEDRTIHNFWLSGTSRISQFEQIDFLRRLHHSNLAIAPRTEKIVKDMMIMDTLASGVLRGKTGWSIDRDANNGWFVGYIEADEQVIFFATNIEPGDDYDMNQFASDRKSVTLKALQNIALIHN